jgi:MFS-type transporter involved in bile tolerance (Atg22 family)
MSLGSAAFAGGSWALLADLVPKDESARFFGLANFSTAGSSAAAGLFGPLIDAADRVAAGTGFSVLFFVAALAFLSSVFPLKDMLIKEIGERNGNKRKKDTSTA